MSHRVAPPANVETAIGRHKFFILFSYLLIALILYPYIKEGTFTYFVFRVVGSVGILVMLYAVSLRRTLLVVGLLLAIPAFFERMLLPRANAGALSMLSIVLSFAFDTFVVILIFRHVFTKEKPSSETVFGALCIYLLIGFGFASLYGMVSAFQPRAFYLDPLTNLHATPDRFDYVYYSFATMTSLGATGITAVSNEARSLAIIETTLGVLYLAVLIARLISAYRHPSAPAGEMPGEQ
ncbi:MAG TPA: ion channel [Verrucomicrobiae bacterium]|jgi:hypothetical protein|nr:ion channel [Verrucomicrobiae bacterium]